MGVWVFMEMEWEPFERVEDLKRRTWEVAMSLRSITSEPVELRVVLA